MGRLFVEYVSAETVHCCAACGTHLSAHDQIVSKAFQGRHGRAFLFGSVLNVNDGPPEKRLLLTGLHVVADIYCNCCEGRLGWKYVEAYEEGQKYKVRLPLHTKPHTQPLPPRPPMSLHRPQEGKFILEKCMILKEDEYRARVEAEAEELSRARASDDDAMAIDSNQSSDRSPPTTSPEKQRAAQAS